MKITTSATTGVLLIASWCSVIGALSSIIIGHTGVVRLNWIDNPISTYAAHAPRDSFITAGMVLAMLGIGLISFLIERSRVFENRWLINFVLLSAGTAISGLFLIATFEETSGFPCSTTAAAIRQQGFHMAGGLLFLHGTAMFFGFIGLLILFSQFSIIERFAGILIGLSGALAFLIVKLPWTAFLGFSGPCLGLRQRSVHLCFWASSLMLLSIMTYRWKRQNAPPAS